MKNINDNKQLFQDLLKEAVNNSGQIAEYYSYFYKYSFGNMLLLWSQGIKSPIATFKRWSNVGRSVKKGSTAKNIWVPVSLKGYRDKPDTTELEEFSYTKFFLKKCIFELNDTTGPDVYTPDVVLPEFDKFKLLHELGIQEIEFSCMQTLNVQGYAKTQLGQIAINPVATHPVKTCLHEIAHCLLHKSDGDDELSLHGVDMPRDLKEVEAETTAYLAGSFFNVLGETAKSHSRGYIQNWLLTSEIPERSIQRIFGAVDKIIKALSNHAETEEVAA